MIIKEKLVEILMPYYDIFRSCEIANQIIAEHKQTNKRKFYVRIGILQELEITLVQ